MVQSSMSYDGTIFEDADLERTWIHDGSSWVLAKRRIDVVSPTAGGVAANLVAIVASDGTRVLSAVWPGRSGPVHRLSGGEIVTESRWGECPPGRRLHSRGRLYLLEGTLDDLYGRVRREITGSHQR